MSSGVTLNSDKTAITRKKPSAPAQWIHDHYLLPEKVINWGEGKAYHDSVLLNAEGYDPNSLFSDNQYRSDSWYDLGVCIYVLNTLLPDERADCLEEVMVCCDRALFAVRTDTKNLEGTKRADGVVTSWDTFQAQLTPQEWKRWIEDVLAWPGITFDVSVLHRGSGYAILEVAPHE